MKEGNYVARMMNSKYSALNSNSLATFGTLEFRHMAGTVDINKISDWINILLQLKVAAINGAALDKPPEVWGELRDSLVIKDKDIQEGLLLVKRLDLWR